MTLKQIIATTLAVASIGYCAYKYNQIRIEEEPEAWRKHTKTIKLYKDRIDIYEKTEERRTMSWEHYEQTRSNK